MGMPLRFTWSDSSSEDTDNIVLGDVAELAEMKLRGHPLAAPRCAARFHGGGLRKGNLQDFVGRSKVMQSLWEESTRVPVAHLVRSCRIELQHILDFSLIKRSTT